jgi:protein O-GlcNAc transferase
LALEPDSFEIHGNFGNLLKDMRRLDEAVLSYQRVLELQPNDAKAHNNLGAAFIALGRFSDAVDNFRRALAIDPDLDTAQSNLLFAGNFLGDQPVSWSLAEAKQFGARAMRNARAFSEWKNTPNPDRSLRVGFVSGDFREHSVGHFLEGVLAALVSNAPGRLELFAYPTFNSNDEVALRLKSHFKGWVSAMGLSDQDLAQRIRDDEIDILIDLSGHTAHNRLPMFAWNPAPVQVTWLGYLATTGVTAIDYVLADAWTLPEYEEANFTEEVWRLPQSYLCFTPPQGKVQVGRLPALHNGFITFGSFNNLAKINDAVVALWSKVLLAVPGSRLYLKSPQLIDEEIQRRTMKRFKLHGIDEGRLTLEGLVPRADYLLPFHRVDIALDPFPYPGITTSVENLWMGVPVLTLAGNSFLSRQGVGLMMNAGLPDWIGADPGDYVARAVAHASDVQGLAELRARLRHKVFNSPIFDAPRFSQHFEAALRSMWHIWCGEQVNLPKFVDIVPRTKIDPLAFAEVINLHVGGKEIKKDWKILNAMDFEGVDFVGDVRDLSAFPDGCCAKVYASHVMEHVDQQHFVKTLQGIHRVLSATGELYFSVPDLEELCRLFLDPQLGSAQRFHVMRMMYGGQIDDFDFHYIGLTHEFMLEYFSAAGFSNVKRVTSFGLFNDTSDYKPYGTPISLNLIARK